MKKLLLALCMLVTFNVSSQEKEKPGFFKSVYNELFKYGTFYVAGNIGNAYETQRPNYFVRTDPDNLYAVPEVVDNTVYHPFDYRYGIGFRKLARFGYEDKPNWYNGTENNIALSAPTSAVKGLEYLIHYEKERERSEEFINSRYFIRHTGKNHIAKIEQREEGNVGFKYLSGEIRGRLPIGKKLSISGGAIYRTHQKAYGYNPIEIWLNEIDDNGFPVNPWYSLGYEYGYSDHFYQSDYVDPSTGEPTTSYNWFWLDPNGNIVAHTDQDFRDSVFGNLMNRYNNEIWDTLDPYAEIAPIVGFDFYHYKSQFWMHAYGNWILPYHKYLKGDSDFNYLNRNNWGKGGLVLDAQPEQWSDYQVGMMFGWKLNKSIGIFLEGEYTKFWDNEIYNSNVGINITFK
tara:strand:- start:763 stop:1965 length:1203 start_codon:yes stop_codon:yes gene_type:complete